MIAIGLATDGDDGDDVAIEVGGDSTTSTSTTTTTPPSEFTTTRVTDPDEPVSSGDPTTTFAPPPPPPAVIGAEIHCASSYSGDGADALTMEACGDIETALLDIEVV